MNKTKLLLVSLAGLMTGGVAQASTVTLDFTGVTFTDSATLLGTLTIDTVTGAASVNATFTDGSVSELFTGAPASVSGTSTDTTLTFSGVPPFAQFALNIPTIALAAYTGGAISTGGASSVFATGIGNDLITGGSLTAVPLPATAWLLLGGLGGLGVASRKRKI